FTTVYHGGLLGLAAHFHEPSEFWMGSRKVHYTTNSCVAKRGSGCGALGGPRCEPPLQHVLDVGGEGRIRVDEVAELGGGDAMLLGEAEDVDQLLGRVPDHMGSNNLVARLVHDHFGPGLGLGIG